MGFSSLISALTINPITNSLYEQSDPILAQPIPPTSEFIITETGSFIVSESGNKLVTE